MAPVNPTTARQTLARASNVATMVWKRAAILAAPEVARATHHALARRDLSVNSTQGVTLGVIAAYVVAIAILWNVPYLRNILWPFKMLTVAFHEFGHAITACCTGGRVVSITLDPNEGGQTLMKGAMIPDGWQRPLIKLRFHSNGRLTVQSAGVQAITLPAGYLGSSLIGGLLIFCGFNINASKIASMVLGFCFLLTLWWGKRDWLTILTVLLAVGLLVAAWFIAHAQALRFVVLFLGVMSALYSAWDICDDLIMRKVNSSDASVFAQRYGGSSRCWGLIWVFISLCFMAIAIVAGIAAFPQSFSEQESDSQKFLPT
ncbi:hypothetical protein GCG54_00013909 [Colletotrichum gloeosporioides]|uniref:Peptidase M50B-like-domain-containing protein n=1 Tax=Colletotrichum gloeosporioides TaxID=474922 RepID=A0A8H4CEV8_COLGL|nr:uncharacterized protein GCG54_00013909 [Colletotrichum gloeosporioides]KAF3802675.1 hypothetical protein GCG54_00013909 [Colletotrichum gloeosporioides]